MAKNMEKYVSKFIWDNSRNFMAKNRFLQHVQIIELIN